MLSCVVSWWKGFENEWKIFPKLWRQIQLLNSHPQFVFSKFGGFGTDRYVLFMTSKGEISMRPTNRGQ